MQNLLVTGPQDRTNRLERYRAFIKTEFLYGFRKQDEYDISEIPERMRQDLANGRFTRIVFTGMGCSAIVSDVFKGFLTSEGLPLEVIVINDYDFKSIVPAHWLDDPRTLFIVSSYSGFSTEPLMAFDLLKPKPDQLLLLTSGGKLAEAGIKHGVPVAYWRLSRPDREYPLFHVTQYFAILLDMFSTFGLIHRDYSQLLSELPQKVIDDFTPERHEQAVTIARAAVDSNIIMIASPLMFDSALKLFKMHLNEIAMVPATRNYFHEFCHSEVATLSAPERRHCVLVFRDSAEDDYTKAKQDNLLRLLSPEAYDSKGKIQAYGVSTGTGDFVTRLFSTLLWVQYFTLELGEQLATPSRDLISLSAGNRWYHSSTIEAEHHQLTAA